MSRVLDDMVRFITNNGTYTEKREMLRLIQINNLEGLISHYQEVAKKKLEEEFGLMKGANQNG